MLFYCHYFLHLIVEAQDSHRNEYVGNSRRFVFLSMFFFLSAGLVPPSYAEVDFTTSYAKLSATVKDHWDNPPGSENSLSVWLNWIGIKADDRDSVQALLDKAIQLYIQNPGNEEYNQWIQKLQDLWQNAQATQERCPGRKITNNSSFSLSRKRVK